MKLLQTLTLTISVSIAISTPQSRPPRPPRPDELAGLSNSNGGKKRPPPPPGSSIGVLIQPASAVTSSSDKNSQTVGLGNRRWIWDDNCKNDRPPFQLGQWVQANYIDCPIAFEDPEFDFHDNFCK